MTASQILAAALVAGRHLTAEEHRVIAAEMASGIAPATAAKESP